MHLLAKHLISTTKNIKIMGAYSSSITIVTRFIIMCVLTHDLIACSMRPKVVLSDKKEVIEQFCSIGGEPDKPFVAGWSVDERQDLLRLARRGGVLLSYRGCTMTVVSRCRIKDHYDKVIGTPDKKVMEITNSGRLYAELPMGARSLSTKVEGGRSLKLSYVVAATQSLNQDVERKHLVGKSCKDATHYVEVMYLGAFRLEEIVKAAGTMNTLGGGGMVKTKASNLDEIGKIERCYESKDNPWCQGIIKIKVSELEKEATPYLSSKVDSKKMAAINRTSSDMSTRKGVSIQNKGSKVSLGDESKRRSKKRSNTKTSQRIPSEKKIETRYKTIRKQTTKDVRPRKSARNTRPKVIFLTTVVDANTVSHDVIRRVVKSRAFAYQKCYEKEWSRNKKLAGRAVFTIKISPTGRTIHVKSDASTLNNRQVERCMSAHIKKLRFPSPKTKKSFKVLYSVRFKPGRL